VSVATNKTVRCCVHCSECGDCYTHTIYELWDLMKAIHVAIADWGESFAQEVNYGYSCKSITAAAVDKLISLKQTIRRFYDNLRTKTMGCLCDIELQRIKEHVGEIIDLSRCASSGEVDIRYDYSQYDQWVVDNPSCVAYDVWEKGMVKLVQPTFLISATKEARPLRTLYAISSRDNSGCIIKLFAFAYKAQCENTVVVSSKNTIKCNIELKALVKKHNCDMSFAMYSTLLGCNLSFQLISTVLGCGGKFSLDKTGTPIVKIGAKSSKVADVVKLAGGTWQDMNEAEFNAIYG